jgi:hypothetical protein
MDTIDEYALQQKGFYPCTNPRVVTSDWYFHNMCLTPEDIRDRTVELIKENKIDKTDPLVESIAGFCMPYLRTKENGGKIMNQGIELNFNDHCVLYALLHLNTSFQTNGSFTCNERDLYKATKINDTDCGIKPCRVRNSLKTLATKKFPFLYIPQEKQETFPGFGSLIEYEEYTVKDPSPQNGNGGSSQPRYSRRYRITLNEKLFTKKDNSYRVLNPNIGGEIREFYRKHGGKPSKYDIRFYDFLLWNNEQEIRKDYKELADSPLLMRNLKRERKDIRARIVEIYELYKELGYLERYELDYPGWSKNLDILYLNPDKFHKIRQNKTIKRKTKKNGPNN